MKISDLFKKNIARPINGVVKADQLDEESVWQELDEFVVTKELDGHLRKFFERYCEAIDSPKDPDISGQIGVWVSGFFGSGKSHFIKVLSHLLANEEHTHEGKTKRAVEFFNDKIADATILGDIKRAVLSDTDVILFNIDSKASSSTGRDAILAVFLKVLNEKLGYSPDHAHIAHMERYLDDKGKYDEFQNIYKTLTSTEWKDERDAYEFNRDEVIEALSKTLGQSQESCEKWVDTGEGTFSLSIENFAKWTKEYLDKKGPAHRLIFLVDEVGQFIGADTVQIMKDYMASGSFARGRDAVNAYASMVFVGNINQPVDTLVKTSHLLAPFPETMIDSAFFDRFHAYIPGWEIPKMRPEFFTNQYGMIVDYLAEWVREMRKRNFGDAINKYFKLGRDLNQRDTIAVKHTVSGLLKLLYPNEEYDKEAVRRCLEYALEVRRRVKEQLKKIGGMEFYDVHFSYIDLETSEEKFISVREQGGGSLIPDGPLNPGVMHTVATGSGGHLGLYRIENQVTPGNGSLKLSGFGSNSQAKEAVKVGFDYFKANATHVSASIKSLDHDYHLHVVELHNTGPTAAMTLTTFIALCSAVLGKPIQSQMVVLGSMSLGGNIIPVESLAESLQVAHDAGAKRVLLPMASVRDIPTIPGELFAKFQTSFYSDPRDAAFKALGVE